MTPEDLITRFGTTARASIATVANGTGYFAVTPSAPYDETLTTAEQARQLFGKAEARLAEIGSSKGAMLFCAILLRDIGDVAAFNAEWDGWVADIAPPARACFEATLANPSLKVELILVCAVAGDG
ncbi:Rid family hydrolase [Pseudoruegeria sp. HB172150]|uniref:Rid family hydrolase n=1 Tax=Pseudoruegeria sp. HB172150 TaxID=2721164 RepID=UPI001555B453|nr:Rid family hydrolase [Pseudoruegeria sp. HB172150]